MARFSLLTKKLIYLLKTRYRAIKPKRVIGFYQCLEPPHGRALVSYLPGPILWAQDDPRFDGHSNLWESAEIARILNGLGYVVDAISHADNDFRPEHEYDLVFDINRNMERYSSNRTIKFLHATGSYNRFSNNAEIQRLKALKSRRGVDLMARRSVPLEDIIAFDGNARSADILTVGGNQATVTTFPPDVQHKMKCLPVTGSYMRQVRDTAREDISEKDFLWFGGAGAVHKGLDLVLEAFSAMPELTLHVIGPYEQEKDFMRAYEHELNHCQNIVSHGYLYPSERRFREVTKKTVGFIFPSCSEGTSAAAVTCMQYGFIPIVSDRSGIDVTPDLGIMLHDCSIDEIMAAVQRIASKRKAQLHDMAVAAQRYALRTFSREQFSFQMESVLRGLTRSVY